MNKPIITISLKRHLADFCRHEFEWKDDLIIVNRKHLIGKRITSLVSFSTYPVKEQEITNKVSFELPITSHFDLRGKFVYVDLLAQKQIADFIETEFSLYVRHFFAEGYKRSLQQKQIVLSFLEHYNIKETALSYEAVKKNDYRNNRRILQRIGKELSINL